MSKTKHKLYSLLATVFLNGGGYLLCKVDNILLGMLCLFAANFIGTLLFKKVLKNLLLNLKNQNHE